MSIIKNAAPILLLLLCTTTLVAPKAASAQEAQGDTMLTASQWADFSENLRKAVASENEGAQTGALSQIIRYGQYLEFDELTVFNVMRMYRDSDNPKIRRMAVVALGNMNNRWAIEFLDMLSRYESDETIKKTMERVVKEHQNLKMGS